MNSDHKLVIFFKCSEKFDQQSSDKPTDDLDEEREEGDLPNEKCTKI